MIPEILATLASGIFAGAALYINLVEQPARLSCGPELAVKKWRPSYRRGTLMQAPLALIGSLLGFASWWLNKGSAWLVGGVLLLALVPFTFIVIFLINKQLESDELELSSARAGNLLRLWGRLYAIRSALSSISFVTFLTALGQRSV